VTKKPTVFVPKKTQTTVKHSILQSYLRAWWGIIISSNRGRAVSLRYVDTCCGSGLYEHDPDEPPKPGEPYDVGSAIIGLQELNAAVQAAQGKVKSITATAILINESPAELAALQEAIAKHVNPVQQYQTKDGLFADYVDFIVEECKRSFSFVFIDPYGPTAVPFSAVAPVVSGKRTDTIIHFPYYAVEKWTGWLEKNEQPTRLAKVDALMNGPGWRAIVKEARRKHLKLEPLLRDHYRKQLANKDKDIMTCSIPMLFPDRKRVLYDLIFTTHNVSGFAAAKDKFQKAEQYQAYLRQRAKVGPRQGALFDRSEMVPGDPVELDDLASRIRGRFGGGSERFDDVAAFGLMQEHVLLRHVQRALRKLRAEGAVQFDKETWGHVITFT